jgi:hypothetical protein
MTPKEAAALANVQFGLAPEDDKKVQEFIASESPRNIQQFIHRLNAFGHPRYFNLARTGLEIGLAEDAAIYTRRIIRLTWILAILTFALLSVEIRAIFFPKNAPTNPKAIQAGQNQQVVIPAVTNR